MNRFATFASAILLAVVIAPSAARAQGNDLPPVPKNFGSLTGIVDDSLRGGRLIGAHVTIVGTARSGTSDINGIFRIDSIPPGVHQISVTHPLLDTLGLEATAPSFFVAAGEWARVEARTPTFEDVRAKSCTRTVGLGGSAVLLGRVLHADSDEPAVGATVSLVFKDLVQKDGVDKVRTGRTGPTGTFAICGLPATISGNLQATQAGVTTADLPIKTNDESLATAILTIGGTGTGNAVLKGTVSARGGPPIGGAQVTIVGTTIVVETADDGTFTLSGLPSGTHEAVVRKIGFAKTSQIVHLAATAPTSLIVALDPATVLGTVHIIGRMDDGLSKVGFLGRKQLGRGWYLTPEQIAEKNPQMTTDLFRMAAGMRLIDRGTGRFLQSTSTTGSSKDGCVNIFIDRARFDQFQPGDIDDIAPTGDLGAIEYYQRPSDVPIEFNIPGKSCATLVIWSKTLLTTLKQP